MKFIVSGYINLKGEKRSFNIEVDAKSEKHAEEIAYSKFGSTNKIPRTRIKIEKVEKVG